MSNNLIIGDLKRYAVFGSSSYANPTLTDIVAQQCGLDRITANQIVVAVLDTVKEALAEKANEYRAAGGDKPMRLKVSGLGTFCYVKSRFGNMYLNFWPSRELRTRLLQTSVEETAERAARGEDVEARGRYVYEMPEGWRDQLRLQP